MNLLNITDTPVYATLVYADVSITVDMYIYSMMHL